jgi:class 3 adenylate cyclase
VPLDGLLIESYADVGGVVAELPSGTVTFVFTDLVVSTRRVEQEPDAMSAALARHDEILCGAVAANGGYVVKGRGDGVHAVFATAAGAVRAAIDGQLSLGSEMSSGDLIHVSSECAESLTEVSL